MEPGYRLPFVTVLVPCRNEADFIERCLTSILSNGYPADRLGVLVVDGRSEMELVPCWGRMRNAMPVSG